MQICFISHFFNLNLKSVLLIFSFTYFNKWRYKEQTFHIFSTSTLCRLYLFSSMKIQVLLHFHVYSIKDSLENKPPVNNGHNFRVPRVVFVNIFDCGFFTPIKNFNESFYLAQSIKIRAEIMDSEKQQKTRPHVYVWLNSGMAYANFTFIINS